MQAMTSSMSFLLRSPGKVIAEVGVVTLPREERERT